jgi:ABC-type molybdate transport system substrate-binding protein
MMRSTTKFLKHALALAVLGLTSQASLAVCTTIGSTGTVGFNLAVASNFYLSAQSIAASFLAVGPKTYDIYICEGSSGNLYSAIIQNDSNPPQYALFLSADKKRPDDLREEHELLTLADPFTYAKGTPVFILSPDAYLASSATYKALDYLNTGLPAGATAQSSVSGTTITNKVKIKVEDPDSPLVSTLAIGNPGLAPYGVQAGAILGRPTPPANNMGQWVAPANAGTNVGVACSTLITGDEWICMYDNINLTLDAINANRVTAGFVSYGQVCPALTGTTYPVDRYVLFQDYPTLQNGILLNVTDGTAETKAAAFKDYMLGGAGSANWNTWLTSHCYQSL